MSDPTFINDSTYVYFTCDRAPTASEPVVNAQGLPSTWLFFWWDTTHQILYWCQDQTENAQIWLQVPKMSDIPAGPIASGDATLALGSATVSLSSLSSGQKIRLSYKSPSGTPGAVYVGSVTPGTGFTIHSTSLLDDSVIHWETMN